MSLLIDLNKVEYGSATEPIRALLQIAGQIDWFPVTPKSQQQHLVEQQLQAHFGIVDRLLGGVFTWNIHLHFLDHDWETVQKIHESLKLRTDLPAWQPLFQSVLKNTVTEALQDESLQTLIGPPVWCFQWNPNIVNPLNVVNPLIADQSVIPKHIPKQYQEIAWHLICDVESVLHDAITWTLVLPDRENPFVPLLLAYCHQGFPLGFDEQGVFQVFLG